MRGSHQYANGNVKKPSRDYEILQSGTLNMSTTTHGAGTLSSNRTPTAPNGQEEPDTVSEVFRGVVANKDGMKTHGELPAASAASGMYN